MVTWAARRRIGYILAIFIPIILVIGIIIFFWWYKAPTCFDGKQNGDEVGIDCGGSCQILCSSQALPPIVLWNRAFEIYPGVYNLVAYVENPNIASEVPYATYVFKVYDKDNALMTERSGSITIPERKSFVVFEGTVRTDGRTPARVSFDFTNTLEWKKTSVSESQIAVLSTVLTGTNTTPRIDAVIQNKTLTSITETEVSAVVFDSNNNAIQSSRTLVENLAPGEKRTITFTWPSAFDAGTVVCATPVDAVLIIDRSGSMNDDGANPPEPLTSVKNAAEGFIQDVTLSDKVAVVSFANEATLDANLASSVLQIQEAIGNVAIGPDENNQNTNIFAGLTEAFNELSSARGRFDADDVIILLTDGIASRPLDASDPDYAVHQAQQEAEIIKSAGTALYTIGLGKNVDSDFLTTLATAPEYYYTAPTTADLEAIYAQIATAICKRGPNVIQIIPRVIK